MSPATHQDSFSSAGLCWSCVAHDATSWRAVRAERNAGRRRDPAEDAALRGDHRQADPLELGEVGADAVRQHEALVAAVVGLADGGVHAHLGGDAGDDSAGDARAPSARRRTTCRGTSPCRACRSRARRAAGARSSMMSWPYSPRIRMRPFGPGAPMRRRRVAAVELGGRAVGQVGHVPLAGVDHGHARRRGRRRAPPAAAGRPPAAATTSLPRVSPNPPGSTKSRCMSMITSAVRRGSNVNG